MSASSVQDRKGKEDRPMPLVNLVTSFGASRFGRTVDRYIVRATGESLLNLLFSRLTHSPYKRPLLLTTIGARTGRKRTVVLPYFDIGSKIVVVGSAGGGPTDPFWARNMRANPRIWFRMNHRLFSGAARLAVGEERAQLWDKVIEREKVYAAYQERAKPYRELPFFVLSAD
jgi:deazaflavin-dependent oxidoreductase (nitroreductase family)